MSSYRSIYLTYRPQKFSEVAGQKAIVRTLSNALLSGKIAHAYLFTGPRGTGKTSMARLFAKALDCDEGIGHQCCECSNCLSIADCSHPDVIEIDAASNNGVDQVRDLIDKVKYSPIKARYKVYIIDEVHMMTTGAFNALLKTLEEPPENVVFILCTTEPYKVLPTVVSRCQRFDFGKIDEPDMKAKLIEVLKAEGATYDEAGLKAVIDLADGGMRDAFSILEQILSYSGNILSEEAALTLYGIASSKEKIELLLDITKGDIKSIVEKTDDYLQKGIDIRKMVGDLIGIMKDLLVYSRTKDASIIDNISKEEAIELNKHFTSSTILTTINSLVKCQNDFKNVSDARSLFELTLLELASGNGTPVEEKAPASIVTSAKRNVEETPKEKVSTIQPQPVEAKKEEVKFEPAKEEAKPAIKETPSETIDQKAKKMFEAPPAFLFDDEKKEEPKKEAVVEKVAPKVEPPAQTINSDLILKPAIATSGDMYSIPQEEIVNILVVADKAERLSLLKKWGVFSTLRADPKLGALASLLSEGQPYCLAKEVIIITYNFARLREKSNIKANQEGLSQMIEQILGRKVFVYAIDPSERNSLSRAYYNLMQVGKLPQKENVTIHLPK